MSTKLNELITELGKIVDGNNSFDKLKSFYEKLKVEAAAEFEYPFEHEETYWMVYHDGDVSYSTWTDHEADFKRYDQGNTFKTKQEAKREREKRTLLVRFRQFRDKCNGAWKPGLYDSKYYIYFNLENKELEINWYSSIDTFDLFGCFKNESDCERAIELFGDKIKQLYVEAEE